MTWILVAQGSAAKILSVSKNGQDVKLVIELFHPDTAKKGTDIYTDRPGRTYESSGSTRHSMSSPENITDHERKAFAQEISDYLQKSHQDGHFNSLIVVSASSLLGELRKQMNQNIKNIIAHELAKDLLSQDLKDHDLVKKIKDDLRLTSF